MRRRSALITAGAALLLLWGCASPRRVQPLAAGSFREDPWSFAGQPGWNSVTRHYIIHTTIDDAEMRKSIATLMEGALTQYRRLVPELPISTRPMESYIFGQRPQWAQFTRDKTGADAAVYLQINRGGYTVRDWYVAYLISRSGTYAVAAHEGWHQFVARHFKTRLPPFLEEGIATMFEQISWNGEIPVWNLNVNPMRAQRLRRAIETQSLWPLEQLITMHAGDVVGMSGERIETFYAQNWAFAMFLWEAEDARYRPAMQRMLSDLASGTAPQYAAAARRTAVDSWNPQSAAPLLQHYLSMNLDQIQSAYLQYMKKIALTQRHENSAI